MDSKRDPAARAKARFKKALAKLNTWLRFIEVASYGHSFRVRVEDLEHARKLLARAEARASTMRRLSNNR